MVRESSNDQCKEQHNLIIGRESDYMSSVEESADGPMIVRTVDAGQFVRVNASFQAKVGFGATELAEKPFLDWIDPCDRALVQAAVENGERTFYARHITRDGSALQLRIQVAEQEEGLFVLGHCAKVPTQLEPYEGSSAEATVLGTLDAIARIVEEHNTGYKCSILLVANGRFVSGAGPSLPKDYNSAIEGYAVGPNVGSCGTAIFWNIPVIVEDIQVDPLWAPLAKLAKKAGVAACWSHPFVSKGGQVLGALALYSPEPCAPTTAQLSQLKAAARMTGLAVERGRVEEELRKKRKRELELEAQLAQAAKMEALGVFSGRIAHDFNNQLQPILGLTDLLIRELKDEKQRCYAECIFQVAKHSTRLAADLLAFAHKGQLLESTPIDIHKTVAEVVALLNHSIKKNVEIYQHLNASPSIAEGDPTQMQNMILNVVLNAIDAMPDGGDLIFKTDIVALQDTSMMAFNPPAGSYVCVQISDTGTGMDEETRQHIFEPLFTTKKVGKGTGMGLASVYGAVKNQKGTIAVESTVGKGTTFSLYLPLAEASKPMGVPAESREIVCGTGHILLVDDDPYVRMFAEAALVGLGYDITVATNGKEAVSIYEKDWQKIVAVLLDISMPEMDGPTAFCAMREINPEVKVILCTGYDVTSKAQKLLAEGVKGFLQKPYVQAEMAEKLAQVLSSGSKCVA